MTTREDIYTAIRNADKAGDSEAVRKLGAYLKTMPDEDAPKEEPPAPQREGSALDAPNAVATGYNRGMIGLAGLPVDTLLNAVDLVKAPIGAAYIAATGKVQPEFLQPFDRQKYVGSSENMLAAAEKHATAVVNPANPEYQGGWLQTAGRGLTAILSPRSRLELANQAGLGVTSALAGKSTYDATGDPALAAAAGLAPHGAQQAATTGVKAAVRGGEAGRQEMAQRIVDLKLAGIDNPSLGLASGNQTVGAVENQLQQTPGAVGVMRGNRDRAVAGLKAKTDEAAGNASTNRGTTEAGVSAQKGAQQFKEAVKARQEQLYNLLDTRLSPDQPVRVDNTTNALAALTAPIKGAPETSKLFQNARISGIKSALETDLANNAAATPNGQGTLPWQAVKQTRTLVGNELADHSMMSDVPRSKWNPLYGALSADMESAANLAGPDATHSYNRATDYTRASIGRMERVAPTIDKAAPEQTYQAMTRALKENTSTFQAVKKTLPEGARGDFAGTVIERLGVAKPGQQNAEGSAWSPETFLTNWNGMAPKARAEMLSGYPNAAQVAEDVTRVAKAAEMMRGNSRMYANPSGTAANVSARTTLGAIGLGGAGAAAGLVNPLIPLGAGTAVVGTNLLARGMTSRRVVDAIARRNSPSDRLTQADINALASWGLLGQQPDDKSH